MTELSGTLEGVGLPAIIRFLTGLTKTGCLRIVHDDWLGEIDFEEGQVIGASLGSRHGLSALDALVQALPGGSFTFDASARHTGAPNVDLSADALQAHLDALVARIVSGAPSLPSVDAVPTLANQDESGGGEDPLPLDRGALQTLLAVDGKRTVREIVDQRGTFDALWQLGNLAEVGLVRLVTPTRPTPIESALVRPAVIEAALAEPTSPDVESVPVEPADAAAHCPKLGYDDDPSNSYGRPTRLHRCFAAGTPLPLSLDQQRELCLSDQFGTCPRLTMIGRGAARPAPREAAKPPTAIGGNAPAARNVVGNAAPAMGVAGHSEAVRGDPEPDDPRIVHLPFAGRNPAAQRGVSGERSTASSAEPTQLRAPGGAQRNGESPRPTPLRARIDRASNVGAAPAKAEPAAAPTYEPRQAPHVAARELVEDPSGPQLGGVPIRLIATGVILLLVLSLIGYLVVPHLGEWFGDDTSDLSSLPNASAAAAGTPVAAIASPRRTPAAIASSVPSDAPGASAANPSSAPNDATSARAPGAAATTSASGPGAAATTSASGPGAAAATSASAANAAGAPAAPTLVPDAAPAAPDPTGVSQPPAGRPNAAGSPAGTQPANPPQAAATPLLDERFVNNARNWPSNAQGTAWLTSGSYRLIPRQAGQFVAVDAPMADVLQDVIVSATFRKLSGTPAGGGFGIILRDQSPTPLDGANQSGKYYVLEVGDKGEVGIWRRDANQWIDVLPWQHADAVHAGTATNELTVSAIGNRLSLTVNGTLVVTRTDNTLSSGRIGLLAGGDGNQVAIDHLSVQTP